MSTATIKGSARPLLFSTTASLGVGSAYVSSAVDVSMYKSLVGICHVDSYGMTLGLKQSAVNSPWDVTSAYTIAPGTTVLNWTGVGQYAHLDISAVNSVGGALRVHVYGVPI